MDETAKPKKLIVWEPNGSGHRFMYVKFIAQYALANGISFQIQTTHEAKALPEWEVHGLDSYQSGLSESLAELVDIIPNNSDCDAQIVVPDADRRLFELLMHWKSLRQIKISLLVMRPISVSTLSSKINHLAKLSLLLLIRLSFSKVSISALSNLGVRLPLVYRILGIRSLFDPVEWNPSFDKSELGLSPKQTGKTLFLVAGELSERKYISEILHAWDSSKPKDAILVLVGRISTALGVELNDLISRNSSILNIDYYVPNEIFDSWIDAADFVFILQKNAGSSGIALKTVNSRATIIYGGVKSHVRSIQAIAPRSTILAPVSKNSISNFLNEADRKVTYQDVKDQSADPRTWAEFLGN